MIVLDTTGPFKPSLSKLHYDAKIVDQFLPKSWDGHVKSKDQIYDLLKIHLDIWQGKGTPSNL